MAEVILYIGKQHAADPTQYQDHDIVSCWNERRMRHNHGQIICHPKNFGFTTDGLRPESLARKYLEHTSLYRINRISKTEVEKFNLLTQSVEDIQLFVPAKLKRMLTAGHHRIFGIPGEEFWYDKNINFSAAKMALVWNDIETDSPLREVDHKQLFLKRPCLTTFCCMQIDEFDDVASREMMASEYKITVNPEDGGDDFELTRRRERFVDWHDLPFLSGKDIDDLENPNKSADMRSQSKRLTRTTHEQTKARIP